MSDNNRRIRAVRNIYDTNTGNLVVPVGAQGELILAFITPNDGNPGKVTVDKDLILRVDFSGNIVNIKYGTDAEFVNGLQGILSTLFTNTRITEIKQLFGTDFQFPQQFPQSIKFFFATGIHLVISDDRVTGTLRFSFFVDRVIDPLGVINTYTTFRRDVTDASVEFVTDHYEWTLNNTAMSSEELVFVRGTLLKENEHYIVQRNPVGTKIIFDTNLVFDTSGPEVDYLVAVYKTAQ